jgi:hypothetical protein
LIDSNSIPRTETNSLSLRQLVHPGCQNAFNGAICGIGSFLPVCDRHVRAGSRQRQSAALDERHAFFETRHRYGNGQ